MNRGLVLGVLGLGMSLAVGCKGTRDRMINQATDSPEQRKKIVDSGRTACVNAMEKKLPGHTSAVEAQIQTFCDCVAVRTSESFTHAELVQFAFQGQGSKTPEQKAKTAANVKFCEGKAGM